MTTLFYILDLRWASFGIDVHYDDLPLTTRILIDDLVETIGGTLSKKWCYVINLIKGFDYVELFESGE